MTTIATMRTLDETHGAVRVEDLYDTDIDDLWQACTTPERLARWIARVEGDLRVGGTFQVVFTSTWTGSVRVEVCDAPHRLLLTTEPGTDDEGQIEAWLTEEGAQTRAGGGGARTAGDASSVPRLWLAGPPRGSRSVAGGSGPGASGGLELRGRGARLEATLGRAHAHVPTDSGPMRSGRGHR